MIVIIDYGMGNVGSIKNMFLRIGVDTVITSKSEVIEAADKLILPGVGAFDNAIINLNRLRIIPTLNKKVMNNKTLILGICLGIQLFSKRSEEGKIPGFGWINAETERFRFNAEHSSLKIPHMG